MRVDPYSAGPLVPLGKTSAKFPGDPTDGAEQRRKLSRRKRFRLLRCAAKITPRPTTKEGNISGIRKCRRVRVAEHVHLPVSGGVARFTGVASCNNVWECPVCAQRLKHEKAVEITHVVDAWKAMKGSVYMATFTVRHGMSDDLAATKGGVLAAWKRFQQGRAWQNFKKTGVQYIRAIELTHGSNGWHPHLHVLFLSPAGLDPTDVAGWMYERWHDCVVRELGDRFAPLPDVGTDFRECQKAEYISKLGLELTNFSETKGGNKTPFGILEMAATGDKYAEYLWRGYVEAMRGTRFLGWSRGLSQWRKFVERDVKEDLDAQNEPDEAPQHMTAREFDLLRDIDGFRPAILEAAERGEADFLAALRFWKSVANREPAAASQCVSRDFATRKQENHGKS